MKDGGCGVSIGHSFFNTYFTSSFAWKTCKKIPANEFIYAVNSECKISLLLHGKSGGSEGNPIKLPVGKSAKLNAERVRVQLLEVFEK